MKHQDIIDKLSIEQKAKLLTGEDFWSTLAIPEAGIPKASLSDGPHGLRKQAAAADHLGLNESIPATCFPTAAGMANTWNPELGERVGEKLGIEAAVQKVNVLLGPGMNIKRSPLCGRNFEYFAEDPYLAGKMSAAYIRGIQKNGISACVKHFACNNQEFRRMAVNSEVDERALREIYLTGFEIAVKEGHPKSIMSSYNRVNGEYANENVHLLKEILRDEWGFDGAVVSDWAGCNDRVAGLIAGSDLEMPGCKYGAEDVVRAVTKGYKDPYPRLEDEHNYDAILSYVENGKLKMSVVDECVDRLLDLILSTDEALKHAETSFVVDEHHKFARQAALESSVLLKNENNVLPLGSEKICFIGDFADKPRYQGAGSSVVNPTMLESFLGDVKNYNLNYLGFEPGFRRMGGKSSSLAKKALKLAEQADTVVFFAGLDEVTEAEGLDRRDMKIPKNQHDLLEEIYKLGKKVVVVLFCGSAVELENINRADAILHAYLGGQAGVGAVLDILTGKENPSGKLTESYPYKYEDTPAFNYFGTPINTEYRESIYVGYRYYLTKGVKLNYPFGHGLSYTTYDYSNLKVTKEGITFDITNSGKMDGMEVAQMYIGKKDSAVFRPVMELKGFKKTAIRAGETVTVSIPFDDYSFRSYNPKDKKWETEAGTYEIYVGASSEDIRLSGSVEKEGIALDFGYDPEITACYKKCDITLVSDEAYAHILRRDIPSPTYKFYKKNRMVIHENCTVEDLRYSKRWFGRLFSALIRFAHWFLWKIGQKTLANTLVMGVVHQPIRGMAKFTNWTRRRMEGFLMMCNGKFFKGLHYFLSPKKPSMADMETEKEIAVNGK